MDHIANRDQMLKALRQELVGPSPVGEELDCSGPLVFAKAEDAYGPFCQKGTREEILMRDAPTKRYGVGVLFPMNTKRPISPDQDGEGKAPEPVDTPEMASVSDQAHKSMAEVESRTGWGSEPESDDFDLSSANSYNPSTMGLSFLAELREGARLVVEVPSEDPETGYPTNGRYLIKEATIAGQKRNWYLRQPITMRAEFTAEDVLAGSGKVTPSVSEGSNLDRLNLTIELFSRPTENPELRLLTVCLVNRLKASGYEDGTSSLFQAYFRVSVISHDDIAHILPYPSSSKKSADSSFDAEEASLALLYRESETFAVGHGCAATWSPTPNGRAHWVSAECLPSYETASMTPDITRPDGTPLQVEMAPLAGLIAGKDGFSELDEVVTLYENWISDQRKQIPQLAQRFRTAASSHLQLCARAAERMRDGLSLLRTDATALRAFRLANHAILLQQLRSSAEPRKIEYNQKARHMFFAKPSAKVDPTIKHERRGKWRAFQIAFLLMAIRSVADGSASDRETVELIWFPTGGGKTEAYLGLAAYSMFMRRLRQPDDVGVEVLMRYTLRLLTAQQFQRASGLICAMEHLRRQYPNELGSEKFSIGIWLGDSVTPNTRQSALTDLRKLNGDPKEENPFLLGRCPWCNAQMGPLKHLTGMGRSVSKVVGYEADGGTVVFKCSDATCEFHTYGLPVYVIDEDIYVAKPTLVIGTVDKFASLAWKPEARGLFGWDENGERTSSPPGLIIQDELHLISGPLGSMVGLFETVIEELCTDRRGTKPILPKIVCSTATIRRYADQIKALYARQDAALFPPPGLNASDSFFAQYARNNDGSLKRGRMYVGVHGPALGSMQTVQVRTFSALLQAPVHLSPAERDPWWTLLTFFNSLRELGTTLTLLQSDIPSYLGVLKNRYGLDYSQLRSFYNVKELTSRLRGDEVPEAITELSAEYPVALNDTVDICLASNIIEVGVDIDRLSLMAIVGQPKTTSQYIQVSGRVGRRWDERPGLVVTLYGASKPRDRSHFEKFRSYHERLYAQVEPTSVTPFSPPVLDRALHAIMVAYARQASSKDLADSPYPYPEQILDYVRKLILARIKVVDPDEMPTFESVFNQRTKNWKDWKRTVWSGSFQNSELPLLRDAGAYVTSEHALISWATPRSMRNVDSQCVAEISLAYLMGGNESNG